MGIFSFGLIGETLGVVLSADLRSAGNTRIPLAANLTWGHVEFTFSFKVFKLFFIFPLTKTIPHDSIYEVRF